MSELLWVLLALIILMSLGYLAGCAGAMRWLTLREWLLFYKEPK